MAESVACSVVVTVVLAVRYAVTNPDASVSAAALVSAVAVSSMADSSAVAVVSAWAEASENWVTYPAAALDESADDPTKESLSDSPEASGSVETEASAVEDFDPAPSAVEEAEASASAER